MDPGPGEGYDVDMQRCTSGSAAVRQLSQMGAGLGPGEG